MSIIALSHVPDHASARIKPKGYLGGDLFDRYRGAIEGARFDGATRTNVATLDKVPAIIRRLRDAGFGVDCEPSLVEALRGFTSQQWLDLHSAKDRVAAIDAELRALGEERGEKMGLYAFQRVGVQWLATRSGALLADDMGLGKTLQTLASIPANAPVLVVCPAVAKSVWRGEVKKWRPHLSTEVLSGRGSFRWPNPGEVIAINYDILPPVHEEGCKDEKCQGCAAFLKSAPENLVLIADEAHALKSSKAQRTKRFRALSLVTRRKGGRAWVLTATPLLNNPPELWAVAQACGCAEEAFGSWKEFVRLFKGFKKPFGGYSWGTPDQGEVEERLRRFMLRRTKVDVAKDLPRKTRQIVEVEIDRKTLQLCDKLLDEIKIDPDKVVDLLEENDSKIPFELWSKVAAALATAKIPALIDVVSEYEEAGEPVVAFSAYRAPVDTLGKRDGWETITGDTTHAERGRIVEAFQAGELKGVACTIQAGGVAITLTRSCNAVFNDIMPTPGLNVQAEDRINRIGQKRPCSIKILVANHKLDERLAAITIAKQNLIDATVEAARDRPEEVRDEDGNLVEIAMTEEEVEARIRENVDTADRAARLDAVETTGKRKGRAPANAREEWVAAGLRTLDDANPDGAQEQNGIGFNKIDTGFGRSLRRQLDESGGLLTDAQWDMAARVLKKYHRQIGRMPG